MFNRCRKHRLCTLFGSAGSGLFTVATSAVICAALALPAVPASAQSISAFLSAPNKQAAPASVLNQTVETFDRAGTTTGIRTNFTSTIGTYTGTFAIVDGSVVNNAQYGAGTGNYFALGTQSGTAAPVTLTFVTPVTYFGLSYNAGDGNNGLTFYDGSGNSMGRYSTATLLTKLNNGVGNVIALDGTSYAAANYFGRPDGNSPSKTASGQDTGEPFAFLNFFARSGLTISRVVFDNSNSLSNGFESDNHTISTDPSNVPPTTGAFVPAGSVVGAAPEPGSLALLLPILGLAGMVIRKRHKK